MGKYMQRPIPAAVLPVFRQLFRNRRFRVRCGQGKKRTWTASTYGFLRGKKHTWIVTAACFFVCLALEGCLARVPASPSAPGRPGTPLENVLAWNAAVANANLAVAKAVIAANETQPPLVDVPTANAILTEQSRIADFNRQLTFLLQKSCSETPDLVNKTKRKVTCGQAEQIHALLAQTKASAERLLAAVHIKDAKTAQLISTNAAAVLNLAQQIVATLKAAGVIARDRRPRDRQDTDEEYWAVWRGNKSWPVTTKVGTIEVRA